jgi:polar amino acid transport system substrate-binding protein
MAINRIAILITSLILSSWRSPAIAEDTLNKIQRTGVLNVALREDAAPFGYLNANGNLRGYCLDFFALVEQQLLEKLDRNSLSIKLYKSTATNRFNLVAKDLVDLECGPNTIRSDIPNIDFSTSFFITGTQFLVKKDNLSGLRDSEDLVLGVINNTTTEMLIAERYPLATLRKYRGATSRIRGVEAVAQGQIDAMVSDGILLIAEAQRQELSAAEYVLEPETALTCERYGMIIQSDDPQWQDFINSVIISSQAAVLFDSWFGRSLNYIQAESAPDFCE